MDESCVAYVLKGYPRVSELFIASEIWRLERLGVPIRLFVVKPCDESVQHRVVDQISAEPVYLPPTSPLSGQPLLPWLRHNGRPFLPALRRIARRHPLRLLRALSAAGRQSVRARKGWQPRTIYVKELLQAIALADRVYAVGDVDHLHAHFAHGTTTVTWLASMLCGKPFSFTGHAKDIYRESLNPAHLLARKMRAADFIATCTAANVEHLRAIEPSAAVRLVYHGLNADFAELLTRPDTPVAVAPASDRVRVVSVGRLVAKKGFDVLVEAVSLLRDQGIDLELLVAGEDGEEAEAIRQLIAARGLGERVRLVGPCAQPELLALMRGAEMFALACRVAEDGDRDGIPNVLVEAMAAGVPVVSTTVSGIPELVTDGENGLLVPPEDPAAMADTLLRLEKDPATRRRLAAAGRDTVRDRFDGDVLARRMARLFAGLAP